jgi:mono/diheme cytochrome c family protein
LKYTIIISAFIFAIAISNSKCISQKKTRYDIADHVTPENKELLIQRAEKGKALYKIHCAGCHGIFTKGKDSIPNFTKIQIDNYHSTALIGLDPKNHAVAKKMSSEQIDYVITFLRIRVPE